MLLTFGGCDKPDTGPKRADHEAAHTVRYHPEVSRKRTGSVFADDADLETDNSSQAAPTSGPAPMGSPVLFVNGETVTVPDILEPILTELEQEAKTVPAQHYYSSMQRMIRRQIDMHVSTLLIYEEARDHYPEQAAEIFDKEVDRRVKEIVTSRYQGVYARYEAQLKAMDLSPQDVKNRVKRQLMVTQYMRDKYKPLLREPPRKELFKYYQDRLDEFTEPERAELFLIEVPVEAALGKPRNLATRDEIETARRKAAARLERAREELESGVEFSAVARAYSKGVKAAQGGAWGEITPATLQGRWAEAAKVLFTLSENQTSEVIEAEDFVFIVRCGKRTAPQRVSFEEAQPKIIERVKDEQFTRLSQEHVESLIAKATIRPLAEFTQAVMAAAPRPATPALNTEE